MNEEGKSEVCGVKALLKSLDTAAALLFVAIFFSQALYFLPIVMAKLFNDTDPLREELFSGKLTSVMAVAMLIPMFFFCARILTVYDDVMERDFFGTPNTVRLKDRLSFLFRQRKLRMEFAGIALIYVLLPLAWTNMALVNLFVGDDSGLMRQLIIKIAFLTSLLSVDILSHLSAFNVWRRDRIECPNRRRPEKEEEKELMTGILPWFFSCLVVDEMLPALTPLISLAAGMIVNPTTLIVIVSATAALFVLKIVRAFAKRRRFYGDLRKLCKDYGLCISPIKKPILSVFVMTKGESFNVTADGKTYSCKLIGAPSKNDPLAIYDNATCTFIHTVRFLRVTLFHYVRSYMFGYEAETGAVKVLIVNPVAKELLTGRGGVNVPIDNGEEVGEYKVFAGTAFINALGRGIIDK